MFGDDIFRGGPSKVEVFTASANLHVWTKPPWATLVMIWMIGAGGGGGGGFTRASGNQGGGGGGGGAGSANMSLFIADLLPDNLYIRVGYGGDPGGAGAGGVAGRFSGVLTRPTTSSASDNCMVLTGGGGGGGGGTGAAGGSAGSAAGGSITSYVIGCTGLITYFQGTDSAGAGSASGTPSSTNNTYNGSESPAKAGRGGAGITTGDVEGVGGARTAAYTPSIAAPGGAAGGGNGQDAYLATELNDAWKFMRYLTWGSSGGGANASGTGGKGGDGLWGGGGSGGGSGTTGGAGGKGGDGAVVITCW